MDRLKPIPPSPEDCCGQGCTPCVNDIYEAELKLWEKEMAQKSNPEINGDNQNSDDKKEVLSRDIYSSFKIQEIIPLTENTKIYRFSLPYSNVRLVPETTNLGLHLILRVPVPSNDEDHVNINGGYITRQYTILSSPMCNGYFDIMIKLYENGTASRVIRNWKVDDLVEFRGPFGEFSSKLMQPSETRKMHLLDFDNIILLAAGTGIAPMVQVINYILDDDETDTRLHLLYSCRKSSEILLKDQIKTFADFWNFKITYFLTSQDNTMDNLKALKSHLRYAKVETERISIEAIENYLISKNIDVKNSKNLYLVCGTKQFEIDIINNLKCLQIPEKCIFKF